MSIRRTLLAALFGVVGLSLGAPGISFAAPAHQAAVQSTHQGKKSARKKRVKKDDKPKSDKSSKNDKKKDPGFEM